MDAGHTVSSKMCVTKSISELLVALDRMPGPKLPRHKPSPARGFPSSSRSEHRARNKPRSQASRSVSRVCKTAVKSLGWPTARHRAGGHPALGTAGRTRGGGGGGSAPALSCELEAGPQGGALARTVLKLGADCSAGSLAASASQPTHARSPAPIPHGSRGPLTLSPLLSASEPGSTPVT